MGEIQSAANIVCLREGKVFCNSMGVAIAFGKRHADVLRSAENLLKQAPELAERNFALSEYVDVTGRKQPVYEMDRDGFSLLAMGFTGKEALHWKLQYIRAFNAMEAELRKPGKEIAGVRGAVLHYVKEHVAKPLQELQRYLDDRFMASWERDKMVITSNEKLVAEIGRMHRELEGVLSFARRATAPEAFIRPEWCDLTDIYEMAGYGQIPHRGLLSARITRELDKFCKSTGRQIDMRIWRHAGKNVGYWRKSTVDQWLALAGKNIIREHIERQREVAQAS